MILASGARGPGFNSWSSPVGLGTGHSPCSSARPLEPPACGACDGQHRTSTRRDRIAIVVVAKVIRPSMMVRSTIAVGVTAVPMRLAVRVRLTLAGRNPHHLMFRTSRCGRDNPGSTPGEDMAREARVGSPAGTGRAPRSAFPLGENSRPDFRTCQRSAKGPRARNPLPRPNGPIGAAPGRGCRAPRIHPVNALWFTYRHCRGN
jgi:hypothetical protein